MTVGFYAPLPPARSGVADYAAALLPALRRLGSVKVNSSRAGVCLYHPETIRFTVESIGSR